MAVKYRGECAVCRCIRTLDVPHPVGRCQQCQNESPPRATTTMPLTISKEFGILSFSILLAITLTHLFYQLMIIPNLCR